MPSSDLCSGGTLGELYSRCASRFADRVALIAGDQRISYREMHQKTLKMVQLFRSKGLKRGDAIAILAGNMPEVVLVISAAQILGVRFTALNALGSEEDQAFILEDAEVSTLVVDSRVFGERGMALQKRVSGLKSLLGIGPHASLLNVAEALEHCEPHPMPTDVQPDDIALVAYTGGTTGRPKGVVHTHRSIINMIAIELSEWEWPETPCFLAVAPVSHAVGGMLLPTFYRGGSFVLEQGFDPGKFFCIVEREKISATFLVPTMLYVLLDHPDLDSHDLSSLEMVIYGAAPIQPARLAQAIETLGPIFCQIYGQVEAPNALTYLRKTDHDVLNPELLGSCGMPVMGIDLKLFDDHMQEVPRGEIGEICARGPHLMSGYWHRAQETEAAIRDDWLHTGDLARMDSNGYIYIVDRSKDMIISGGFNVYPSEVEAVLSRHPAVSMCAVIGVPHATWGEAVKAVLVLKDGMSCSEEELINLVRDKKGSVQAPKMVEFVGSLPLTPLGKIDKKVLRKANQ